MFKKSALRQYALLLIDLAVMLAIQFVSVMLIGDLIGAELFSAYNVYHVIGFALVSLIGLAAFKVYTVIWRYAHFMDLLKCGLGVLSGSVVFCLYSIFADCRQPFGFEFSIIGMSFSAFVIVGTRLAYRVLYETVHKSNVKPAGKSRTLIIGAGACGRMALNEMIETNTPYMPVCMVDDNATKIGRTIEGIKIYGPIPLVPELCRKFNIKTILFAIPSCEPQVRNNILKMCGETECEVKIVPNMTDLVQESSILHQAKDIKIEDLLGRDVVNFDNEDIANFVKDEICLVTGGGGSIGSELCRQIAMYKPKKIVIVDIYENNAYDIQQELLRNGFKDLSVEISSVRDFVKMDKLFKKHNPTIVFHAAAHKHVPLMEDNPEEAVKNNCIGTLNIAMLSERYDVKKMVLISTDKAVNPTNVMGASKRCCEMIVQYMAQQATKTKFTAVRFGNVLGSNGSVIPLFRKQIETGGPVTVTHPDIIRYFMTIPEAVSLVLEAGTMAKGGDIFVLDMGSPVKITTLAENLIRVYGYEPYTEMPIKFTGLRPGEKLFEELLMSEEGLKSTASKKIFIGKQIHIDQETFIGKLSELKESAMKNNCEEVVTKLAEIVPTFDPKEVCKKDN